MYIRKYESRFCLVIFSLLTCLFVFSARLIFIQIFRSEYLSSLAERQHNHLIELEPIRGAIYDRNYRPLAVNIPAYSIFANPRLMSVEDKRGAVERLSPLLGLSEGFLKERLSKKKYFVWLKRKVSLEEMKTVKALHFPGVEVMNETRRYYPNGLLAAHIIGFAGMDNEGLEGLELVYNRELKGESGWTSALRDARQREILLDNTLVLPKDGFHVVLTIDETIQYIAEQALDKAYQKYRAKGASIIVLDVRTGEILALANRPTFNLQDYAQTPPESRTNRAVQYLYEPGSVFKIVTAAAALEQGVFDEEDRIFCENGAYRIANHTLHDHHPHGTLTFREVFELSSNIGVSKIAQELGADQIFRYARKFQFGEKTGIDLTGEAPGLMKPPADWSKTSVGAIPIGQEVMVTPLQLVCALAAVANGGVYMRPFVVKYIKDANNELIKSFEPRAIGQIISPETARRVTEILTGAVEKGTGRLAQIKGVKVAGKTGTAQKVVNGAYSHSQFYATFMGFAPADDPRLAVIAVFDEPRPSYFGGTVAAPVFKEVVEDSLKYLDNFEAMRMAGERDGLIR